MQPPSPAADLSSADRADTPGPDGGALVLDEFLPYRLSVLSNTVSRALARTYAARTGITPAEWRLVAILARFGPMSGNAVATRAAMDKVQVSRAVSRAVESGLVHRATDTDDRRRSVLSLTATGRAVHDAVVPHAHALQRALEAELGQDTATFSALLDRLQAAADRLAGPPDVEG